MGGRGMCSPAGSMDPLYFLVEIFGGGGGGERIYSEIWGEGRGGLAIVGKKIPNIAHQAENLHS